MSITKDQLEAIVREFFDQVDTNKNGILEKAEVREVAMKMKAKMQEGLGDQADGWHEERFEKGFSMIDKEGAGKLTFEQVLQMATTMAGRTGVLQAE